MSEYLAPAVYVEETSFRPKPLEGASTSTTAFVGRTRRGPVSSQTNLLTTAERDLVTPELITSVGDFERMYGSTSPIGSTPNYLAHAVRGFFANGGRRLYVARVMQLTNGTVDARGVQVDGTGSATWLTGSGASPSARFEARFPGTAGNGRVSASEVRAPASLRSLQRAVAGTMVCATGAGVAAGPASEASSLTGPFAGLDGLTLDITIGTSPPVTVTFSAAHTSTADVAGAIDAATVAGLEAVATTDPLTLTTTATGTGATLTLAGTALATLGLTAGPHTGTAATTGTPTYYVKQGGETDSAWHNASASSFTAAAVVAAGTQSVEVITFNIEAQDADRYSQLFGGLGLSALHPNYMGNVLGMVPPRRAEQLENLVALVRVGAPTPFALYTGLTTGATNGRTVFQLGNGTDGSEPGSARYADGLEILDGIDGISIVAAPGSSAATDAAAIRNELIINVEARGAYRIAVLDAPAGQTLSQVRAVRASIDSDHAALYHPWIIASNPDAKPSDASQPRELAVPPSGHVCGIYARNDAERGVHKAPANEVVLGALRFESNITMGQQEVLNPEGINCLRSFRGRGHRVWGARLASSDPEFRYVNVRRFFNYISSTLDNGTQWVVFEPNNEQLWERVIATVSDFLYDEWTKGALLGRTQNEAFFVRCGRSTMTQNDIDNGRLICEVGMAIVYPAEFVIFRIGQKTATSNS